MSEAEIQNAILVQLGREPDVTLWRNNTGQAKAEVATRAHLERLLSFIASQNRINDACSLISSLLKQTQRFTHYGLCKGSSDIIGIVQTCAQHHAPCPVGGLCVTRGIFLALEVKTESGRVSPEQKMFLELVNKRGGIGRIVRSVDDARKAIDEARAR